MTVLGALLVLASLHCGRALLCYTCSSHYDYQCSDPFFDDYGAARSGERYLQDCNSEHGERVFCRSGCLAMLS
jgi:hypothetical protein